MAGYDYHVTDPAADDADRRLAVCPACRVLRHDECDVLECGCECLGAPERAQQGE